MEKMITALGLAGFLGLVGLVGKWESTYSRLTVCTEINYSEKIAVFTDNSGNDWEWELKSGDSFELGKAYRLIMDDNHTLSTIKDDRIEKIKKN